jgi:uncharacterized glyoxalase superfamily protein PhnB
MATDRNLPSVYPTLRYRDARAAITFLGAAFGLTPESVVDGPDGSVAHAELGWGSGIVMLSTRTDPPSPFDLGPACLYLAVDDPDAHHAPPARRS